MTIYSFYIFDRHSECIYSKSWLPPPRPESLPTQSTASSAPQPPSVAFPPSDTFHAPSGPSKASRASSHRSKEKDDAKLIFGTVFSLRNMVRKLGGDDDAFVSFRTAEYKLHYYETPSNLKLVMLTDTGAMSMRNVLHQIYINLWVEYVVKNPLSPVEHPGGEGVKNELFELGLDQFARGIA